MSLWNVPALAPLLNTRVGHALGFLYYAARFALSDNRDKQKLAPKLWAMGLAGLRPMDANADHAWYCAADPLAHRAAYVQHVSR